MPEIRRDPLTGEWVVIAPGRGRRPQEFARSRAPAAVPAYDPACPFCPGNEGRTPPPKLTLPPDGRPWAVRCFDNRFPALGPAAAASLPSGGPLLEAVAAQGAHEVIVETPVHNGFPAGRMAAEFELLVEAYRQRSAALLAEPGVRYMLIFKNHGEGAGTSLVHPHSQLVATPVVPERQRRVAERAREHMARTGRCLVCALVEEELRAGTRVLFRDGRVVAFTAYAGRQPGETLIAPVSHGAPFVALEPAVATDLARALARTVRLVADTFADPDYNYVLHQEPADGEGRRAQHWYIQVLPRLAALAGFELGSGMGINPLEPEVAAAELRAHLEPPESAEPGR